MKLRRCRRCKISMGKENFTISDIFCNECQDTYIISKKYFDKVYDGVHNIEKKNLYNLDFFYRQADLRKKEYKPSNKVSSDRIQKKLRDNLRARIRNALKNNQKSGSAVRDLGCTIDEFKEYLEINFQTGMNWGNYGNGKGCWSLDHIVPLSKIDLTDPARFLEACHYTNLIPMWHIDNIKKGNRIY